MQNSRRRSKHVSKAASREHSSTMDSLFPSTSSYDSCSDAEIAQCATRIFARLHSEASQLLRSPLTAAIAKQVIRYESLPTALAALLAAKICPVDQSSEAALRATMISALDSSSSLRHIVCDLAKMVAVDPAVETLLQPFLFFKGFHAVSVHRVANLLWRTGGSVERAAALFLQSRASELFGVDIHPAATVGSGVMLDHASGVVIGGTAVLGCDLYILHSVTLGATGKPTEPGAKRHPTIGSHCTLGAGCTVLGNVSIGDGATVGAAAVATRDVPPGATLVGVNKLVTAQQPRARL